MANRYEIKNEARKSLTIMQQTKKLGGTLDDAIAAQEAAMEPEDVELVMRKFRDIE
jgi:hypothetical protein